MEKQKKTSNKTEVFFYKLCKMKTLKFIFAVVVVALLFGGCKYDFIVPEKVIDPDDPNTEQVSFLNDILPIFTNNNSCTSCHQAGGIAPDLSAGNAYSSINSAKYINSVTPEESLIYTEPDPANTDVHSHKKYSAAQAALILTWIKQGAQDN